MPTNQKSYGTKLKPLHDLSRDWNANFLPYKAVKPKCELSEKNMQIKNIFKSTISNYQRIYKITSDSEEKQPKVLRTYSAMKREKKCWR